MRSGDAGNLLCMCTYVCMKPIVYVYACMYVCMRMHACMYVRTYVCISGISTLQQMLYGKGQDDPATLARI